MSNLSSLNETFLARLCPETISLSQRAKIRSALNCGSSDQHKQELHKVSLVMNDGIEVSPLSATNMFKLLCITEWIWRVPGTVDSMKNEEFIVNYTRCKISFNVPINSISETHSAEVEGQGPDYNGVV